jgi:hypothetical protein
LILDRQRFHALWFLSVARFALLELILTRRLAFHHTRRISCNREVFGKAQVSLDFGLKKRPGSRSPSRGQDTDTGFERIAKVVRIGVADSAPGALRDLLEASVGVHHARSLGLCPSCATGLLCLYDRDKIRTAVRINTNA